jgi:hypothetical protein
LNTLLIGLGAIGLEYDLILPGKCLTHAKSVSKNKKLILKAVVDLNKKKLNKFTKNYTSKTFKNLEEALNYSNYEFIIISVPTKNIYEVFRKLRGHKSIKHILLEKPGADSLNKFQNIYKFCQKKKISLFLNYNRSYLNFFTKNFKFLKKSRYFKIIHIYSRGLKKNASHFLNLLFQNLSLPKNIKILRVKNITNTENEIFADILIKYRNGEVYLISNETSVFVNETKIISEDRKILFDLNQNRIQIFKPKKFELLKGQKKFIKKLDNIYPQKNYQKETLNAIMKLFNSKKSIAKLNKSNVKTLKFIEIAEKKSKTN